MQVINLRNLNNFKNKHYWRVLLADIVAKLLPTEVTTRLCGFCGTETPLWQRPAQLKLMRCHHVTLSLCLFMSAYSERLKCQYPPFYQAQTKHTIRNCIVHKSRCEIVALVVQGQFVKKKKKHIYDLIIT